MGMPFILKVFGHKPVFFFFLNDLNVALERKWTDHESYYDSPWGDQSQLYWPNMFEPKKIWFQFLVETLSVYSDTMYWKIHTYRRHAAKQVQQADRDKQYKHIAVMYRQVGEKEENGQQHTCNVYTVKLSL